MSDDGPWPLADLIDAAERLELAALRQRYAAAFLVRERMTDLDDDDRHRRSAKTGELDQRELSVAMEAVARGQTPSSHSVAARSFIAYGVKKSARSAIDRFITIGRSANNDVVLFDPSISGFHAVIREPKPGTFNLEDAASQHGTTIDGVEAPQQAKGAPFALQNGARVRFGQVECTFMDAAGLLGLRHLIGSGSDG